MNIAQLMRRSGQAHGDSPALYLGDRLLYDYRALAARVAALAGALRERGIGVGERVAIYASNVPEYLEALHAIYWCGAVSVPVNYKLHARELAQILDDAQPALVLVSEELLDVAVTGGVARERLCVLGSDEWAAALRCAPIAVVPRHSDDLASLFYTSGTTGKPKGVMQSHRNLLAMTACYFTDVSDVTPEDAMVYAAPMSHGAGLYNFAHVLRGARHVVPNSRGFDPAELLELGVSLGRLSFFAAPTMVRRLVLHLQAHGGDPRVFRTIVYGGGPMYVEDLKAALQALGPCLAQIYGQGETPMTITALSRAELADQSHPRWEARIASVGIAQSLVEVRVQDDAGQALCAGEIGEVVVRGDTVMTGYWHNHEATAATLKDGWLHTGDTGSLDANGFLTLRDRSKDLIISGGSNIYPREVEEVLLAHTSVAEVAVVGQRDEEWGEVPVAFVVPAPGRQVVPELLDRLCLENLARFKRPKLYQVVDQLPKNSYGKVLKTELRLWLASARPLGG